MKTNTSLTTPSACGRHPFNKLKGNIHHLIPTSSHHLIIFLLSSFSLLLSPLSAQVDENRILDSVSIQKNELKVTLELEEIVIKEINNMPEGYLSTIYGIKKEQLENLHLGNPIPWYQIVDEKLYPVIAMSVNRLAEGESLSLRFSDRWLVPVVSDDEPLFFAGIEGRKGYTYMGPAYIDPKIKIPIEQIHNYEHKDLLIGSFEVTPLGLGFDFLIIRKEDKDIFVEVYNETTGEYFKNEYSSGELIKLLKDRAVKEKEARSRYYAQFANKSELEITPEITKMVVNEAYSLRNTSDEGLSYWRIKNRAQLENVYPGKPIPKYIIVNENLTFTGEWNLFVMSDGEPLFLITVKLNDDGQCRWASTSPFMVETIQNFEYKDLIIGSLKVNPRSLWDYLIIRKNNKDIFVKTYDEATREFFKTEYSFSEIINLLRK